MKWALLAILGAVLFLALVVQSTEHFVDPDQKVTRPCVCPTPANMSVEVVSTPCDPLCAPWESKVTALAPTGAVTKDYIAVLQVFYDQLYKPSPTRPTEAQINTFLSTSAGTVPGIDVPSLKRIIMTAFHIESSQTAAQAEAEGQAFKPSDVNLAPGMGRDEVRTRAEGGYTGANPSPSIRFPEGEYAAVTQSEPLNPGQWEDGSTLWKGPRPAAVCPCAENIV